MRTVTALLLILLIAAMPILAAPSGLDWGLSLGGGIVGAAAGLAVALGATGGLMETIESRAGRMAVVFTSVAVGGGLGAGAGVLVTARLRDQEGNVPMCFLGGVAGALASLLTEPLLYMIGLPEEITEFAGMLLLPVLPALGATIGFY